MAATTSALAENGIKETRNYTICPGDTMRLSTRSVVVYKPTTLYDTLLVASPTEDSIIAYVVNLYPHFEKDEYKRLQKGATYDWQDTTIADPGVYVRIYHSQEGCDSIYRLHVTQPIDSAITFTLCDDESITFNGRTYSNAGTYTDILSGDTVYTITIIKHPSREYVQYGVMDRTHPYYWQYTLDGELKIDTITEPGRYVYSSMNPETGCNDRWILILTKDETIFHSIETEIICESEEFNWRNHFGLNKLGVGQTTHYYDRYRTVADQDSIYELILTVKPVLRSTRTIPFCGSIEWNGKTYTETQTIVDSLTSVQFSCDSIVTTILVKGTPVTRHDTISILGGEVLSWHGQTITTAGDYTDVRHSLYGCDTTFYLHVTLKEPAHVMNTHSEWISICQGDGHLWRGDIYYNTGIYYDTIKNASKEIDSLYILYLTVNPTYAWSERVTFLTFPTTYREQTIPGPGAYVFTYQSSLGCDSIITSYIDQEVYRDEQTVTICPGETHIWSYDGETYTVSGKYTKVEKDAAGNDSVIHVLNLTVRYIPETQIEHTMCKGETYIFADQSLTESGVYRHTYHKTGGCDSVVVLSLNVLSPDTTYLAIQRPQGESYAWDGETIRDPGMYFHYGTNRFGCDSVSILQFTYNQVDTVSAAFTVCPNELPYEWNGISANQTNHYSRLVKEANGNYTLYVLDLTVREVVQRDTTFAICEGGTISFNGVTYDEAGHYRSYLSCDTLMNVHIIVNQPVVYETRGTITDDHGFTWQYIDHGTPGEQEFTTAGTYEYENPNPTTGCNDIYRLILTKDETSYHFEESLTICEGDDFTWHGLSNLSSVTGTNTYTDAYETRAGKDSIYTLHLTVTPVERTVRTIFFCGETTWNGKTYSESTVVYDTISLPTGCYRIERINLDKEATFYHKETKELPQGTVLHWHGQNITTDGTYYDYGLTVNGCDSTYEITVTIIPATPQTNQYAEELSTCEGDTIVWRGKDIWRSGVYVDTVYAAGTNNIDSIFTLTFTAWPAPKDTIVRHMYTCSNGASIRYNGKDYYTDTTVITNFKTIHGCDSIVKVYMHFNTALSLSRTDTITDNQLPYTWTYQIIDTPRDTVLTKSGTYTHIVSSEGGCTNQEELTLVVLKTYLFELDTTVCETDLPLLWRGQYLQHAIGQTKQYEDVLKTVNNTDSIYRINLTIDPAPKRVERISICENKDTLINGKSYFDPILYPVGQIFRDTMTKHNSENECDSIIYYEITKTPQRHLIETRIMHIGDTIVWQGDTITELATRTYTHDTEIDPTTGCEIIYQLRVVAEHRDKATICVLDTPYVWAYNMQNYYSTGLFTDTTRDAENYITEYHTLDLTVKIPVDTLKVLRGCKPNGVTWNGVTYLNDTVFRDTLLTCDTLFTIKIKLDTNYNILRYDTICEHNLPYVVGQGAQLDSTYREGWLPPFQYKTACGCDSIVQVHLTIIPDFDMDHSDSIFVCEESMPMYIGDTVNPAFDPYRQKVEEWKDKWIGVKISKDTVIYNCGKVDSLHIIMRPHQSHIPEYEYSLCKGDSVQLFWPHKDTWIKEPGDYYDTIPTTSSWVDPSHNTLIHDDRAFACDSIVMWKVRYTDTLHVHLYEHIRQGETYRFNDSILSTTGVYDSIGYYINVIDPLDPTAPAVTSMDSAHHYCKAVYTLHLTVEPVYRYRDTIEICYPSKREYTYTFNDDLEEHFKFKFQTPDKDTAIGLFSDSTKHLSYEFYDHFYDLVVYYKKQYYTLIKDTLCYGDSIQFDQHFYEGENNRTVERYLTDAGIYYDTLTAQNGCDSVIELRLELRDRIIIAPQSKTVTDRQLPYVWINTWREPGATKDTTHMDSLYVSGEYTYTMPNRYGCDSTVTLSFTVHQTHVFRDTLNICAPINTTLTHVWATGHQQQYTTPLANDTIHYPDTLVTFWPLDSIYDLYVDFHRTYETHVYDTICAGDSTQIDTYHTATLPKRFYKETGIYRDTIEAVDGCDSVVVLHLQVWPGFPMTIRRADIADVDTPYLWTHTWMENGQLQRDTDTLYIAGGYSRTLPNIHGCDSIDSLTLYIHQTYRIPDDTINICEHDVPYTWRGLNNITATGDYEYGEQTVEGYDSVHYVHVNVWKQTYDTIYATICEGDSIRWGMDKTTLEPRFVHTAGLHNDTTINSHGCDQVNVLNLTVHPRYYNEWTVDIADVDTPYVWKHFNHNGDTIGVDSLYATDKYGFRFQTAFACDSIDSLNLFIHNTYKFTEQITICERQTPYKWQNRNDITESGTYIYNPRTKDGYDSIYIATITVMPTARQIITEKICKNNLPYNFHGTDLWTGGIYIDTLASIQSGCDSIVELHLNVNDPYYHFERHDIYEGETYSFFGQPCTKSGTYTHSAQTPAGCDSISELMLVVHPLIDTIANVCAYDLPFVWVNHWSGDTTLLHSAGLYHDDTTYVNGERTFWSIQLNVIKPIHDTIRASICEGSSYPFIGMNISEAGTYRDTTQGSNGCDSITTLILTVNRPYYSVIRETILEGNSVDFYGKTYNTTGTYTHYARTPEGCDSTTVLQLTVHPLIDTLITVCNNDLPVLWTNRWNGQQEFFYSAGLYRNDTTINSEKRFYGIQVNVLNQVFDTIRHAMCEGASYEFKGNTYYEAGLYRDTLRAANGCDSIVTLILTVNKPYYNIIRETILEGNSVDFYGKTYNTTGTYTHYARTPEGCDSTTVLQLTVHPLIDTLITVCNNDLPVLWTNRWNGQQEFFYSAGLYRNDTTINSEKRFYGIQVNVLNQVFDTIRHAMCEGASYEFKGNTYYEAGLYRDTLRAANGCDSIVTLILTVNKPYYNIIRESILEGQYYVFFGDTIRETRTVSHSTRTPEGCDSTTVLELTVHQLVDTVITVCSSELPYIWHNRWNGLEEKFYGAGTYRNDTTIAKEHLYYGVQLVVTEPTSTTIYREICEGDKYNFNNRLLEFAGEYRDTLRNTIGCDSVIILHLNVLRKYYHTVTASIYEGDSTLFQGQYFKEAGAYPFRFTSSFGCDSVVELQLSVNRLYEDSVSICSNELPYLWHGKTILESGVYRDTVTNTEGKETVVGLKVNVMPTFRAAEPINVTICEGDYYKFGRNILTEQGQYYDTLTAQNGCDSIVMLALRVIPVKYQTTTKRIFEGDSALFNGVWYKESGVYEYRELNEYGCSDTYQLILTVLKTFNVDTTAVICDNELPFLWRGYEFNETGDYSLPIAWTDSSRVVKTLHLTVHKTFYAERNINLCSGDEYRFKDSIYTKSGIFYDTIPSPNGCDSIIKYIISVHPTSDKTFEKHISDKEPYIFHDRVLTLSGTYEWTGKTIHGCDSMEHLLLHVHPSYFKSDTVDLCQSDTALFPYKWKDENDSLILEISQSGVYTDSILTAYGFDSVRQVVVNIHPAYMINEQYEIGEGEVLKIHGEDISQPGVHYIKLYTVHGCDSIYHIVVNKKRTREFTWTKSICQGETFDFFGRPLTKTGQYKYTSQYKDSVVTLVLTVNPVTYSEKRVVITDKTTSYTGADGNTYYTYIYDGVLYDSLRLGNNLFNEQYVNQYGCDSIARLIIFVSSRYSDWTPMALCPGAEIKIDGDTIREPGLYSYLRRSKVTGEMDSIWRVEVYEAPAYEFDDTLSLCEGDTVFYGNVPITHGGLQDIKLKTQEGCDSIYHLNVTVYPSYRFDTTVTIFDYESFTWELNHQNYRTEGTYSKTFPTKQDPYHTCDSTYVLNLKVIPTSRYSMEYTICDGQEYTWRGKTYSVEGFYYDTVANLATFVSSIYSLHLMVSHPTYIKSAKTTPICADDLTYSIEFEYDGAKPALYSIYYDQRAKDEGFKDVINKPFLGEDKIATDSMPVKTDVIYLQHTNYVKPNKYYMSLVLDNGVCGQSRAENIELTVKYPSWIIEQCWNDVVVPLKKELNGGYEFSQADWIVNGVRQPNNGRGYLEYNFRDGDEVVMIATRKGENYAIETCPLVISLNPTLSYDDPILIYPTQAPKQMPRIHIESPMEGTFEVYGSTGTLLFSGHFDEGDTQVTLPAINGIYFIRTSVGNDTETHKVIIY